MSYSARSKTLALLPKFTGSLSFLGSTFIFQDVVFRRNFDRMYHRLVLGLSCADMIVSVINILSTWPIPEGSAGVYLASGTTRTCTAQGFFNELGNLCAPLYNSSLCVYYVLVIRNGWSEEKIKSKAEPLMHAVPASIAFLIAILGIPFNLYNNSGWLCWIAPYPKGCRGDECTRGEQASTFRWVHYAIIWSSISLVTVMMLSIYRTVRAQERRSGRWSIAGTEGSQRQGEKSRKVAVQAALFVGALYLTWFFTTVARIYQIATGKDNFALLILMATFFPLQGFFNCLIYLRPRYLQCRKRNPHASVRRVAWLALHPKDHPIHGPGRPGAGPDEGGMDGVDDPEGSRSRPFSTGIFGALLHPQLLQGLLRERGEGEEDLAHG